MGMAAPHCTAFVNPKCVNDAKQKQRVRVACVLNGNQNDSAVYGAAVGGPDVVTTNSLGGPLVLP